jgi:hypothetical protein
MLDQPAGFESGVLDARLQQAPRSMTPRLR